MPTWSCQHELYQDLDLADGVILHIWKTPIGCVNVLYQVVEGVRKPRLCNLYAILNLGGSTVRVQPWYERIR